MDCCFHQWVVLIIIIFAVASFHQIFFLNEQKHNLLDSDESSILTLVMVGSRLTFLRFYINSMGCDGNTTKHFDWVREKATWLLLDALFVWSFHSVVGPVPMLRISPLLSCLLHPTW